MNHGVSESVLDEALDVASKFFGLPTKEKAKLMSNDVHKPVRCGTSLKDGVDKFQFWRVFLKHYAHPLKDWIHMWPENPPDYRYIFHLLNHFFLLNSSQIIYMCKKICWGKLETCETAVEPHGLND